MCSSIYAGEQPPFCFPFLIRVVQGPGRTINPLAGPALPLGLSEGAPPLNPLSLLQVIELPWGFRLRLSRWTWSPGGGWPLNKVPNAGYRLLRLEQRLGGQGSRLGMK